jgi:hypothetical protein
VERLARLERERLQLEQREQDQWHRQDRLEGRERQERQERQERERLEREQQRQERERRAQLLQQLEAPPGACPGGLSLNHLSSLRESQSCLYRDKNPSDISSSVFLLVLSALALALVGWFIFLGLLLTIRKAFNPVYIA